VFTEAALNLMELIFAVNAHLLRTHLLYFTRKGILHTQAQVRHARTTRAHASATALHQMQHGMKAAPTAQRLW